MAARRAKQDSKTEPTTLIFDSECPVCVGYSEAVDTDLTTGPLQRISARTDHELVKRATAEGLDLDEGMVVLHQGKFYHGADALRVMADLAPRSGLANRLNRLFFRSTRATRLMYPVLRGGRNALLRLLGRTKIGNLAGGRAPD